MSDKTIQLKPKTSHFFWSYLAGIILIPLLGLGIYIIYKLIKKQSEIVYKISNHDITLINSNVTDQILLANIKHIDVSQSWIDQKFNTGTLNITTGNKDFNLIGLENPHGLKDLLLKGVEAEKERLSRATKNKDRLERTPSIHLDKLDTLTGLWQQGLLSDEDYHREKKHFES